MKKYLLAVAMALALAPVLFSQAQAVVKEFKGKVEIKAGDGEWQAVTVGMKLDTGASISTGFSSTAMLDLGYSTLKVSPLTRMQLVELIARQGNVSTTLALKVGRVNAEVKTVSGLKQDFTLKGPQATAAVRGTEFEFDGVSVKVINGLVFFSNTQGQGRGVGAGEASTTNGTALPTSGDKESESTTSVQPHTSTGGTSLPPSAVPPANATVTITWPAMEAGAPY